MEEIITSLTSFEIYDVMDDVNGYIVEAENVIKGIATYLDNNVFLEGLQFLVDNVSTYFFGLHANQVKIMFLILSQHLSIRTAGL